MRGACIALLLCAWSTAYADGDAAIEQSDGAGGFLQGVIGLSLPVAGHRVGDASGAPRIGLRFGAMPFRVGRARLGVELGADWLASDELRALVGARIAFVSRSAEVFFRAAAGYDRTFVGNDFNEDGYAFEPGFGAAYRLDNLRFGGEVMIPVLYHPRTDQYELDAAQIELALTVAAAF
jgi:hypothetical protein